MDLPYVFIVTGRMLKEISAKELSRECRDYMRIKTAYPERTLAYLRQHIKMDNSEIVDKEIHLFNVKDGAAVNQCMFQNGDVASEISFRQLDLEEYFMRLMGGDEDA